MTMRSLALVFFAAALWSQAAAQGYPAKPVRTIVASPPGAPSDLVMRFAAPELGPRLGQPLVIDNRVSASEIAGHEACAKAAPDGHTICVVASDGMSNAPNVFPKLPYDPDKDFKPIARLYFLIEGLAATASLPANSVKELQALSLAKPGYLNFGTRGSRQEIFRQWLADLWKADIVGVPYKAANPVINALVAGEIHVADISLGNAVGLVQAGKIKMLAVDTSERFAAMPNVATFEEAGIKGATTRPFWGIAAPAATPDAIVARLNKEFVWLAQQPKFIQFMQSRYLEIAVSSPEEFGMFLKSDREFVGQLIKKYNIPQQ